jgi:hypothetical protein
MDEILLKLKDAIQIRTEADKQITEYTNAVKALARVVEDEDTSAAYLIALDEIIGKYGFMDAVRFVIRGHPEGLTPQGVRDWILIGKKMDLSVYTNPLASIHTTLRRLVDAGEVEIFQNSKGEKAYCVKQVHPVGPKTKEIQDLCETFKVAVDKRRTLNKL